MNESSKSPERARERNMKSFVVFCVCVVAVCALPPPPPHVQEKIARIADFINSFAGSKAELEAALVQNFQKDHDEMPAHITKEMIERFIDDVASKLTSTVMSGDDFKKFSAEQMAKKGKM
jgi:hypothetical protein